MALRFHRKRILGKVVECDNYQDARKFLLNSGEKGRQLGIIHRLAHTASIRRCSTSLRSETAHEHGMVRGTVWYCQRVEPDMVGIVTTLDGNPSKRVRLLGPRYPVTRTSRTRKRSWMTVVGAVCRSNPVVRHMEPQSMVRPGRASADGANSDRLRRCRHLVLSDKHTWTSAVWNSNTATSSMSATRLFVGLTPLYPGKHPLKHAT